MAEIISVKDNVISQVTRLFRSEDGKFDVSSTDNFEVKKGEVKTREKSFLFGLIKTTEKYRTLNVTQTSSVYHKNQLISSRTKTYTKEEIID